VLHHDNAFAIAKHRQADLEADAATSRLTRKREEPEEAPPKTERPRLRLFARPRTV